MRTFLLVIVVSFLAVPAAFGWKDISSGSSVTRYIGKGIGEVQFKLSSTLDEQEKSVDRIEVLKGGKEVQWMEVQYDAAPAEECELLHFEDLNFDGYQDVLVLTGWGPEGKSYDVWIYNRNLIAFEKSPLLSPLRNYTLDQDSKEIQVSSGTKAAEGSTSFFKVVNGRIELYKEVSRVTDKDGKVKTTTRVKSKKGWKTLAGSA